MRSKNPLKTQNILNMLLRLLFIILPVNLGLHFVLPSAYVGGLLVDYLVPTIYLQDIVVLAILLVWFYKDAKIIPSRFVVIVYSLLFTMFLSSLLALRFVPAVYSLLHWVLYGLLGFYLSFNFEFKKDFGFFAKVLSFWIIFLGFLSISQFYKQGSLFNNYLFLGEQPYSLSTPLIDKENVFGYAKIPAYGLFRHPNIFGGFLAVTLVLVLYAFKTKYISVRLYGITQFIGVVGLFLTFSYFSWAGYFIGVILLLLENKRLYKKIAIGMVFGLILTSFFIHKIYLPKSLLDNPSVFKRIELLEAGYEMTAGFNYLFGAGLNNFTVFVEKYTLPTRYIRFVQPTHNIFILIASEAGLIALCILLYLLYTALKYSYYYKYFLFVLLTQIIFMSCFDHYFITIHQTFLLLWILLGLVFV